MRIYAFSYQPVAASVLSSGKRKISSIERIENTFTSFYDSPERGAYPKELLSLGIREYREIFFKPYRIIYHRILNDSVYVMLIVDGRRHMQTLLERRLLEA